MHLHSMTFQALGPFPGRHTIDFAEVGASGIFLLEGPTGAGKSTIIDAVVFALYGKVASKDASEDRLRSGHADPDAETFVDLVLESGSGVFRVRRTPAYDRPKQRGTGTTRQQSTVRLWRLASPDAPDDGELMSMRHDEAGPELERIIGLDRAQFVQTVVLPQGEFASFLRANPEDRRGLLQKVFGTEIYEQLQVRLERMRAEMARAVEESRQTVGRAVAGYLGAVGLDEEDAAVVRAAADLAPAAPGDGGLLGLVRARTEAIAHGADAADRAAALAGARRTSAAQALETTKGFAAALGRRTGLRAELDELTGCAADHAARQAQRAAAHRARAVLPLVTGAEAADAAVAAASAAVERARRSAPQAVRDLVDELTEPSVQRKTLTVERDRCMAVRGTLVRVVELEARLPGRHAQIAAAEAAHGARAAELERTVAERAARPDRRTVLTAELAETALAAGGLPAAEQRAATAEARLAAARDVAALTAQVEVARTAVAGAARTAQDAVARSAELHQARIAGIAGELAARLQPGEACAVCGAVEHPSLAAIEPGHVTAEDLDRAEVRRAATGDALTRASSELTAVVERLEGRRAAAEGADVTTARGELDTARAAVTAAAQAADRHRVLEEALAGFDLATEQLERQVVTLSTALAVQAAELAGQRRQVGSDQDEVAAARDGAPTVRDRVDALERRMGLVTTWADAVGALEDAESQQLRRAAEVSLALAEHGFDDAAAVRAAHLPDHALADLDRAISVHEQAAARVAAGLADAEVAALPEVVDVDVDAAQDALRALDDEATTTASEAARSRHRATASAATAREVERALADLDDAQRRAGPVTRMANLAAAAAGDNTKQLTLATYVLTRRFEDVVAAANARLGTMSDGRYELMRSTEREDVRTRRTGLAMKVLDHRTETERDPRTLSGGETFYVSLCLALGLADVVTAEAGGIDLGTLFVDEGFGSLDAETLEVVLAELGRLRDGGRVVGVVSHVEAMKGAIAERIEVRCRPDGSSTLTVRA